MTKRASPLSSKPSGDKDEGSAEDETTSSPFRDLAKKLVNVPVDKVRAAEKREKKARERKRERKKQ